MICHDLLSLKGLEGLTLLAGQEGLDRTVRWIYFSDVLDCIEGYNNLGEWIYGGELLVITNERLLLDVNQVMQLMREAHEKNASGLLINEGRIVQAEIGLANELKIPLFELPLSMKAVDLSQIICTALIAEQNRENSLEHLLSGIIYDRNLSEDEIQHQAAHYGFDLRQDYAIAVFSLQNIQTPSEDEEKELLAVRNFFQKIIKSEFQFTGGVKTISLIQRNSVILLFPAELNKGISHSTIYKAIRRRLESAYKGLSFSLGIGSPSNKISLLKQSYWQADRAVLLAPVLQPETGILYYDHMGIYTLLFSVNDTQALENYYKSILGPLMEFDKTNHSELCRTLEVYLNADTNASLTSETLNIHRNTLHYRLDKIKLLLNVDLEKLNTCVQLTMAFNIKKYLEILLKKQV